MRSSALFLLLVGGAVVGPPLSAQAPNDLTLSTANRTEFGGALGRVARLFGGGRAVEETTRYSGPRMRTDRGRASTVYDAAAGSIMEIQHDPRTYWLWTVDQPLFTVAFNDSLSAWMEDSLPRARRRAQTRYEVTISTERGKREKLVGLDAQQLFLTVTITGETYNQAADSVERGTLVVLSELWQTEQFPGAARTTFDSAWAARTMPRLDSAEIARMQKSMERIYEEEPRLRVAVARLDSALADLGGTTLRSVAHYVAVPEGARFDRAAVLRDAEKTLADDAADAAVRSAENEGRRALGRIAGIRLGGQRAPRPEQAVIMRTRYAVTALTLGPIAPESFQAPAGYTRKTPGS